jgi:acyl-coenzyme A synthetase/AMP-(fatty) acid ligase
VIYTSGSTGQPKGVQNEHRALVNRLTWMQQAYQLDETDAVLQKTPFSFDVSGWEFFWTLLNGAKLVIAAPSAHKDSPYLVQLIKCHQVTTVHFVPSMLGAFANTEAFEDCTSLRRLICSGEELPAGHIRAVQRKLSDCQIYNLYGPTEAAIDVTAWDCPRGFDGEVVPIGRPIANTQLYVLDQHRQPVPLGAVGEIYIGGVGVARGYLNQPQLTAQRFVADPYSAVTGARMYRTGDLGRYRSDGNLEFLGRNDQQVKIRGFRIEPGEIEARLLAHPALREAAVIAREDAPGEKRLMAYVTRAAEHSEQQPGELMASLRAHLSARLPEYMLPAAFVCLDRLPLTPNGKLDRKALPAPDANSIRLGMEYVAPRTPTEQMLADVWSEVLKVERVGIHDNFFALGGHSLLALRILTRIRLIIKADLTVQAVFRYPTIEHGAFRTLWTTRGFRIVCKVSDNTKPASSSHDGQLAYNISGSAAPAA